jgi:hypothetical protein
MAKSKKSRKQTVKRRKSVRRRRRTVKRGGRALRPSNSNNQRNTILYSPTNTENTSLENELDFYVNSITSEEGYDEIKDELADMIYTNVMDMEKHKGYGLGRYQTFEDFEPHIRSIFHLQEGDYEPLLRKVFELYSYLSWLQTLDTPEELYTAHAYLQTTGFSQ